MYLVLSIIVIIVCVLLGIIVLIQNPKGGGLSSNFSSSSQLMGVQKTGDFLEKGTWILAITLMVLALAINVVTKGGSAKTDSQYNDQLEKSLKAPVAAPSSPTTQPLQLPAKK
ncbi:MAG: preprotein translocase subunit SecG [Mucilaginibacter sp.]|uniref:preprotein translocase subunit SecG n=1 Tax=Mucilaginibacter sp. TaxID=1882438 RepID=UPI0026154EEE|nr:preprotein translocase subunit SecG [Mucilaginibacter sp.]MDB5003783.1 preprotein translocase subunit SecG [Mucilaginibacter sp.]